MKTHTKSALVLAAVMALSLTACAKGEQGSSGEEQSSPASETVQSEQLTEDVASAENDEESTAGDALRTEENISLYDCSVSELIERELNLSYTGDQIFWGTLYDTKVYGARSVRAVPYDYNKTFNYARQSTNQLVRCDKSDSSQEKAFEAAIKNKAYIPLVPNNDYSTSFNSAYSIDANDPLVLFGEVTRYTGKYQNVYVSIKDQEELISASVYNCKANAFIRKCPDNENMLEMVIDPAYMYGIPTYHRSADNCRYNINGTEILADSVKCYIEFSIDDYDYDGTADVKEALESIGTDYVYASFEGGFSVCYSTKQGYISPNQLDKTTNTPDSYYTNRGWIQNLKILTTNTDDAIDTAFSITSDLGTEADKVYNAIIDNTDTICKENTIGIKLIDLDTDGTPELLVSNYIKDNSANYEEDYAFDDDIDTDIYRIKDGKLVYIDTLYNPYLHYYGNGNVLGKKYDENGNVLWFTMSRLNRDTKEDTEVDYLFTLEGDKLKFTEMFRQETIIDEDNDYYDTKYYYMGKPLEYKTKPGYNGYGYPGDIYYYGDIEADSGLFELFGYMQQDFANSLKKYDLNTDWLMTKAGNDEVIFIKPDERTYRYGIAYMVDSFYAGKNSDDSYIYNFLGDYEKPVIYLYPEEKTDVSVKVNIKDGELTCTYPDYNDGWNVTAYPDGTLINKADGREYSYLYWEGKGEVSWDMSEGFVVKGSDTAAFLQEKLEYMGLTPKEYNEFIVYWLPLMQDNEYNLIKFQTDDYEEMAKLDISPTPDSMLRIFMTFVPLDEEISVPEQQLETFERKGFAVVEWGGAELKQAE